jgi:hypothetical protein
VTPLCHRENSFNELEGAGACRHSSQSPRITGKTSGGDQSRRNGASLLGLILVSCLMWSCFGVTTTLAVRDPKDNTKTKRLILRDQKETYVRLVARTSTY